MSPDHPFHPRKRILSFHYAIEGIIAALTQEPNIKIHATIFLLVITAGTYLQISQLEWILIFLVSGLVFSIEMTNTAIEAVVDSFTDQQHPGAKLAKDISAGAVLITAISAAAVGLMIFLPYFVAL